MRFNVGGVLVLNNLPACSDMRMRSRPYVISTAVGDTLREPACWKYVNCVTSAQGDATRIWIHRMVRCSVSPQTVWSGDQYRRRPFGQVTSIAADRLVR